MSCSGKRTQEHSRTQSSLFEKSAGLRNHRGHTADAGGAVGGACVSGWVLVSVKGLMMKEKREGNKEREGDKK